jgi:hypothetical protein
MSTRNAVTSMRSAAESADRVLTIERVFDAPRHLVFKAWTEPQQLYRWFGPRGFTISSYTLDPRPGALGAPVWFRLKAVNIGFAEYFRRSLSHPGYLSPGRMKMRTARSGTKLW